MSGFLGDILRHFTRYHVGTRISVRIGRGGGGLPRQRNSYGGCAGPSPVHFLWGALNPRHGLAPRNFAAALYCGAQKDQGFKDTIFERGELFWAHPQANLHFIVLSLPFAFVRSYTINGIYEALLRIPNTLNPEP